MDREQMLNYFEKILKIKSEYVSTALDICRRVNQCENSERYNY